MDNKILYTAKFTQRDLKFHKVWLEIGQKMWKLVRTNRFLYTPQTMFVGGINMSQILQNCQNLILSFYTYLVVGKQNKNVEL